MSSSYYLYTEIKLNNEWVCVNQSLFIKDEWVLIPTYESHSGSYFRNTYDKLSELGMQVKDDLSKDVLKYHPMRTDKNQKIQNYYDGCRIAAPLSSIKDLVCGKEKQYHGFYHKDLIFEFENGEREDLYGCEVDPEGFSKLPKEIRDSCYSYYEWEDPMEWHYHFKLILDKAISLVNDFKEYNQLWFEEPEARIVCIMY